MGATGVSAFEINLTSPTDGEVLDVNAGAVNYTWQFKFNASVPLNILNYPNASCFLFWNVSSPDPHVTSNWTPMKNITYTAGEGIKNVSHPALPNGTYKWNVMCLDPCLEPDPCPDAWGNEGVNWIFTIANSSVPDCTGLNDSVCLATPDCTWESYAGFCILDCFQYDGVQTDCENAFGGFTCEYDTNDNKCRPSMFTPGFEGFSFCPKYDGNQTACDQYPNDCVWASYLDCSSDEPCYDSNGSNHGWCNSKNMLFTGFDCWELDGNKSACLDADKDKGWACEWHPDPWGPLVDGTEAGYCDNMMGGGGGCWENFDETSCNTSIDMGMPCVWRSGGGHTDLGYCEWVGCWDIIDPGNCTNAIGCYLDGAACIKKDCWEINNESACDGADTTYNLNCTWYNDTYGSGWCEEDGCWKRDWTNVSWCENMPGCRWDPSSYHCVQKECWEYDTTNESVCNNAPGLNCEWKVDSWGWCEQKKCNEYTNESACVNTSATVGMSCAWDSTNTYCYQNITGCSAYSSDQFGCFETGYCFWNPDGNGSCDEPTFVGPQPMNPSCGIFDKAGETKCTNVSVCNWTGSSCEDYSNISEYGVNCSTIMEPVMCENIPMLATCCMWTGNITGCQDAPFTTSCWDSMQEPPEGAYFCDDYNAKYSKKTCEQIAGDPWYMPCYWDNVTSTGECKFSMDDMFGGMMGPGLGFKDIGSKSNCESLGGVWKSEKWTDPSGATFTDEWCEMGFGFGKESCTDMCWACEFQSDGSDWSSTDDARTACEESAAGCVFFPDSWAPNGKGWCDKDWAKTGNCDQNCWECWDQTQCKNSLAGCKWFTDSWNGMSWCDDKNIKTCDDDCYMCWDQDNCGSSPAGCSWDTNFWYCSPQGTGGEKSEVCFDGIDNDDDTFMDCADPECMFDPFCGGSGVFGSECLSITDNSTGNVEERCTSETYHPDFNCTWIVDPMGGSWCDMPGADCWLYDKNASACDLQVGCRYTYMNETKGLKNQSQFCDVNFTKVESASCWDKTNETCSAAQGCIWVNDPWCSSPEGPDDPWCQQNSGWCDFELFSCFSYGMNQSGCEANPVCNWTTDPFNPQFGWCDPACFARDNSTCSEPVVLNGTTPTLGVCQLLNASEVGWCEPENMFKGCWEYDDNETACNLNNATCTWIVDPFILTGGFCGDKFMHQMVGTMDQSPPLDLAWDDCGSEGSAQSDICFLGIKDDPGTIGFGIGVYSMDSTAICKDRFNFDPTFTGTDTAKFYLYIDANGNHTGGCSPDDNSSMAGYDFKFKYGSTWQNTNNELLEIKVAYKCLSGNWSPSQIKLITWPEKMCYMLPGGVIAVDKGDLDKLKVLGLFNDTEDMKIYATTADNTTNASAPSDRIGPTWYSPGTADVKFEDCLGFVDADGDGLAPSDDPDCINFLRYGYIEAEMGIECGDNIDNDGNGFTDCNDPGCMYDPFFCSDTADSALENDTSAPSITWLDLKAFTDGAFIDVNTNEPTNATVSFYGNNNNNKCANSSNSTKVYDPKLNNSFTLDDYDLWHGIPVDNTYFTESGITFPGIGTFTFSSNVTYFYKLKLCDKAGLCTQTACLNFTTATTESNFTVAFGLPPPQSDATGLMGAFAVQFDWGGTGTYEDTQTGDSGYKINQSKGKKVNLKFTNPNATKNWSIDFIGAGFLKAQSINVTDAFILNDSSGEVVVGILQDKWKEMGQSLGVDYVKITIPVTSSFTSITLKKCPDNSTSVGDASCKTISLTDVNCTIYTTKVECQIPTSLGFSVYGVAGTVSGNGGDSPPGGGGPAPADVNKTATIIDGKATVTFTVEAGKTGTMIIPDSAGFSFKEIAVKVKNKVTNTKLEVYELSEKPSNITADITTGVIRSYIQLDETNIQAADIDTVTIRFKVPVSWITEKNIDKTKVVLNRYADGKWNALTVTKSSEDNTYVHYSAASPGLSTFGVSGQVVTTTTPVTTAPPTTTPAPVTTAPPTTAPPTVPLKIAPPEKEDKFLGICGPSVVLLLSIVPPIIYGFRRKRR